MDNSDFCKAFEGLTLGLPPKTLQLEGGNVVIKLSDRPTDTLVLHEKVLGAASERFAMRFNSRHWGPTRVVEEVNVEKTTEGDRNKDGEATKDEKITKYEEITKDEENTKDEEIAKEKTMKATETINVYEYYLIRSEDTFTLTDEKEKEARERAAAAEAAVNVTSTRGTATRGRGRGRGRGYVHVGRTARSGIHRSRSAALADPIGLPFQRSALANGYNAHPGTSRRTSELLAMSIAQHKVLFRPLYNLPVDFGCEDDDDELIHMLTEVTALAEYYLLLPTVAHIGEKLRSFEIFSDALRHYVGRKLEPHVTYYEYNFIKDPHIELLAHRKAEEMRDKAHRLTANLRQMTLCQYQANRHLSLRKRGPEVFTTWDATSLEKRSVEGACTWIADSVFREKLDAMICGEEHWSHVEYVRSGKTSGMVPGGSLFAACNALRAAEKSPYVTDVFGKRLSQRFAAVFNLHHPASPKSPQRLITEHLRYLVRRACRSIKNVFPASGEDTFARGPPAKSTEGSGYFTNLEIHMCDMPWSDEIDFSETQKEPCSEIEVDVEVEEACEEWLKTVL